VRGEGILLLHRVRAALQILLTAGGSGGETKPTAPPSAVRA
jgi:hypothetical protein